MWFKYCIHNIGMHVLFQVFFLLGNKQMKCVFFSRCYFESFSNYECFADLTILCSCSRITRRTKQWQRWPSSWTPICIGGKYLVPCCCDFLVLCTQLICHLVVCIHASGLEYHAPLFVSTSFFIYGHGSCCAWNVCRVGACWYVRLLLFLLVYDVWSGCRNKKRAKAVGKFEAPLLADELNLKK
jgi:hypothetical protein